MSEWWVWLSVLLAFVVVGKTVAAAQIRRRAIALEAEIDKAMAQARALQRQVHAMRRHKDAS